jgi:drug/metabolite transporter (DMT)-like permease
VLKQFSGVLLFHEKIGTLDVVSFALMSFGCVFQLLYIPSLHGAKYVLLSSFFWTVGYIMLSYILKSTPTVYWSVPIMEVTILLMSLAMGIFSKQKTKLTFKKDWNINPKSNLFLIIAVFIYLASLLNNYAFQQLPITTINIYQLSLMPIGYVLSLKIFKERPSTVEIISFCTGFSGFALFIYVHSK